MSQSNYHSTHTHYLGKGHRFVPPSKTKKHLMKAYTQASDSLREGKRILRFKQMVYKIEDIINLYFLPEIKCF